jgi:hypothetical protein
MELLPALFSPKIRVIGAQGIFTLFPNALKFSSCSDWIIADIPFRKPQMKAAYLHAPELDRCSYAFLNEIELQIRQ